MQSQSSLKKDDAAVATGWRQNNLSMVEKLSIPAVPSAFPNASVRVCGYELEDICGASSVYGSG